ncbi:hypothetical protein AB9N12_01405 [Bacteroides sp. AN502(2024)]|uniref:LamG-like jellyroll fold domain-containing protein n=1 Tax=Bacteroides sp. AN502(2024) TaxID=3160599 RepID=UPI003513CA56
MALTDAEKTELKKDILNAIKAESQGVDELAEVTSLDNVKSLPALRGNEVVSAPLSLLGKPATDAAAIANAAATRADTATGRASEAANVANSAAATANEKAGLAQTAANNANKAVTDANDVKSNYESTAKAALQGATARFEAIVETGIVKWQSAVAPGGRVVYLRSVHDFVYELNGMCYNNWNVDGVPPATLYHGDDLSLRKDKVYMMGGSLYVWSDEENDLVEISGSGGGNILNVTETSPLSSGYHTLATAVAAVDERLRGKGRCITYEVSQGKWETKQFTGTSLTSWEQPASWEDFGGAGTMKSLTVNGEKKTPDAEGNVSLTIEKLEIDGSLNAESTNPVENRAVAAKLGELDANTIFGANAELSDDETSVRLTLTNKSGVEVVAVDLPAGSGGGGDGGNTTKIVLGASVDKPTVKEGDAVRLTYTYDHQYGSGDGKGESTGQKARITVQVRRGATTTYSETTQDVSKGTYTLDLTKYLLAGTSDIYVIAETSDPTTGKAQKKQAYVSVRSVTLALSSGYNIASGLNSGGYGSQETAAIPYAVSGTGTKVVTLYVDGRQKEAHTVTRSGTTNGSFSIPMSGLSVGRHTVQMVAEMEAGDGLTLKSESVYIDILKSGSGAPHVGLMITHRDGRILTGADHLIPVIEVGQYESCEFRFAAYDPGTTPASVGVYRNGTLLQTVSVPRTAQTYRNRFTEQGRQRMQLKVGPTTYSFYIDVSESGIDISEATYGLQVKLSPSGRSNGESDPARWEYNGVNTVFEGFDWSSNGWTGDSLRLTNGAKAVIGYQLFKDDAGASGATIEIEFRVGNVVERGAEVISCMDGGKGLSVTTEEASIKTGTLLHYTNEDGEDASREIKIGTKFAPGEWLKVAFVIGRRTEGRLMELYVNGNRAGADIYDNSYYFRQDHPAGITIDSGMADVELKTIRIYDRALTDDEILENRMVDAGSTDDMMRLYEENDILGDTGDVDIDRLRSKGKGVMRIVRVGGLDEVNETNNKKTDFMSDVYFYSPFGKEYDFVLRDCYIRIQGTSSTKYPSKNIRVYFSKGGANLSFEINGVAQVGGNYAMRPGSIPMNLFCMKSDYSDSSMSLNTGVAKLYNDVMLELGLLTPPQRYQYEQAGGDLNAVRIRQSIDGFPIDVFSAETADGESTYYGQYNFNNEKSKSGKLFGMEGVSGYAPECPMTLETLNNGEKVCLFQSSSDTDLASSFDAGLETNWPDDVKWAGLSATQQTALKRLYGWIRACVPANATAGDLSTFASEKFKSEVSQYFDVKHLLTYYIHTDYFASVDQRAKNILLRTWDGLVWYLTYYDGDTQLGKRNDCFLAYDYTLDRDTWDAEAGKYAFEGRESWLWNLVLANLRDELKTCAAEYRSKMTVDRVLSMLDGEQAGNWSDRAYNKSGYLKYIRPNMEEVYGKKWPFIYALQGSNAAHRSYFVRNRFALLDAKYGTSNFTSDNIDLYMARAASDSADVVKITSSEVYAFGYGTNNSPNIANTGIVEGGKVAVLQITGAYTVNDPLRIYGASRMRVLDMTGATDHLKNGLDLGKCTVLRELNLQSSGTGSTGWWLNIGSCRQLRKVNVRNQAQAKTGSNTSTELDFSNQTKLEELDARGTRVQSVTFAKGAPLTRALLPGTLTVLKLEYLGKLTTSSLTLESYGNVKTLIVDGCPGLNWETLLSRCANVDRIRVTGIDREDDGTWLNKFINMGGVDAEGNATDTCGLVGTVRLTHYMDDEKYTVLKAHFPELNILQPDYTMIEFDDDVADDANVSNLDNRTGYKYGNAYVASGHIAAILKQRHRVLAKMTKKPTTRNVNIANVDTVMNNLDGEMTCYPLDDTDSNKYADGSAAKLDGTEGDWMMYEPFFWSKGINDYLNGKHYSCYSSNGRDNMPATPEAAVLTLDDIKGTSGGYLRGRKIMSGKDTLPNSYSTDGAYSVCKVNVSGYKRVRFPSVPGTNLVGSVFTDESGGIVSSIVVPTLSNKFEAGMYLVADVPAGATALHFSVLNTAEFDVVVLSNSDKIEDMEPDWVPNDEHLCAVVGSSVVGSKLRACTTGGSTTASMSWTDLHYYSVQRGMQQIDALMHSRIANLFYARYGRRDSQEQCGAGQHTNNRVTGGTASHGMTDTIGYEEAKTVNANITNSLIDNLVHQYAWYRGEDDYGGVTVTQVNNSCCLGYEDIFGNKYDMMDGVDLPNTSGNQGKWRIWMPDGSIRWVKGKTASDQWTTAVAHGKYMDVIPVGSVNGSSSTHYCDKYWINTAAGRVVFRGFSYANAYGGVSYASAYVDASVTSAVVGSRLAFRGKIVRAQSVAAFKAMVEVA